MIWSQVYSEWRDAWNTRFILEFIYLAKTVLITEKTAANEILQQSTNREKVEGIVAKRFKGGQAEYFIQWQNYSSSENRWKPAKHFPEDFAAFAKRITTTPFGAQSQSRAQSIHPNISLNRAKMFVPNEIVGTRE